MHEAHGLAATSSSSRGVLRAASRRAVSGQPQLVTDGAGGAIMHVGRPLQGGKSGRGAGARLGAHEPLPVAWAV
jgi:hypothetical protein